MVGFWRAALVSTLLALSVPALAQKAYVRDDLATEGQRLEERLKRDVANPGARPVAPLLRDGDQAINRGDARRALGLANTAVVIEPRNPEGWRLMARAAAAIDPKDYRERYELQERAIAAAYLAYQRSATKADEAASLAVLGKIFEGRELWRPALTVYRLSLEAQDNPATRRTYEELRDTRGFRLTENKVDADSANPRACFTFSEPLAKGRVDFAPYVQVTGGQTAGSDFAVTAEGTDLCVDGLRHGERYGIVVRQGVPSAIAGEALRRNASYDIYVRDRKASVRFTGKNYVLPKTGQQGVPVVSVNTERLAIDVLRIGDRNLINSVKSDDFLTQIGSYGAKQIADESGQKVWTGTMEVKPDLNKDVVTAFPVIEAVGKLEPGLYVMFAKPATKGATPAPDDDADGLGGGATQWFVVSDFGLTGFTAKDGLHVLVRSLATAAPMPGVELRLIAKNNEVLATARTDAGGYGRFDAGLARGQGGLAPGVVVAEGGGDYGFLDFKQTSFDLTDRGVKGRIAPTGLDAFLYTERGVYRSGETVYLTTLLRDGKGAGVTGLPLTMIVRRPDGVEYRRQVVEDQGGGGRALSIPLISGAQTGTWRVAAYSDPKREPIGDTTFLVEDYVPERLAVEVKAKRPALKSGEPAEIDVNAKYLYGAPGADLEVSGEVTVRVAAKSAIPGFEGYSVGLSDETVEPVKTDLEEKQTTDAAGNATVAVSLQEPATNLPLEAEILLNVAENGGRAVSRSVTLPILPKGMAVGVRPLFADGALGDGDTARFEVIMATGEGRRLARPGVKWTLSRVLRNYQWFFQDGRWTYEGVKVTRRIEDGEIFVTEAAPATVAAKVGWGSWRLDVRADGAEGAETSIGFTVGYETDKTADTPDTLEVALDKPAYAAGETMKVRIAPRFAGKVTLAVVGDAVSAIRSVDVPAGGTTIDLPVGRDWGASAYLVALAHRPLDTEARRMPGRAIGLAWFTVDKEARTLGMDLGPPNLIRPRGTLDLPVKLAGLAPGEDAWVTVAAVDIGILNLTRYEAPNPTDFFFGQKQLGAEIRDLYGLLIDGMQGTRGQIRTGGDAASTNANADKPTQEPLARYSGVVKVGPDGTARISFDIPAFNGAVRVMGVAWTKDKTGQAAADVIIRDPVVVQATLPRFLAIGDQSRFFVEINNVEGQAGDYVFDLDLRGPVAAAGDQLRRTVRLPAGGKTQLYVPVTAAGLGTATFDMRLTGPGLDVAQQMRLRVQPSTQALTNRTVQPIPGGGQITIGPDLLSNLLPGSGSVAVSVSPFASLDVPALLTGLDRYPYGCTEQTISRAMPLLYVNRLASLEQLSIDTAAEDRVNGAIERVLSRQDANGSFGLWSVGGDDLWLDAFTADFLTRARERNFAVPGNAFSLALDRLRNQVANTSDIRKEEAAGLAYAIYVLARNGRSVMGDLRYLVDNKLGDFPSPMAKGHLAAALALLGDRGRAKTAFTASLAALAAERDSGVSRSDYGTKLRDGAAVLALLAETGADRADIVRAAAEVDATRTFARFTSTQEKNWMVMAAQALQKESEAFALTVDGVERRGAFYRTLTEAQLAARPLVVANPGQGAARAVVTVSGIPVTPEPALDQGYAVERTIYGIKGEKADPQKLKQNERYVVVLKVSERAASYGRLLLVDPLPAGLEIENPALTEGGSIEGLAWFKQEVTPANVESRDDRYVAAFDRASSQPASFTVAYIVRAVSPGRYVHPAAAIEDMYRPDRFGRTAFGGVEIAAAR